MKTCKAITVSELNGRFRSSDKGINEDYLNQTLITYLMNTENLYNQRLNTRRKPESVAWEVLMFLANDILHDSYNGKYYASSNHLKSWLETEGRGYDTIKETVDYIKAEREQQQ